LTLIKQIVGFLYTGSLIIDDIEDDSPTRRGQMAAHVVYGVARALNAGNCKIFLLFLELKTKINQGTDLILVI
jgi:geranylgeranyl diphosphate synthase type 3